MSAESAPQPKPEQLQSPDEFAGLHTRLLLANNSLLNPDKEFPEGKEKKIERHLNKRNYQPFERTSEYDRKKFWEGQTASGKVEDDKSKQYEAWEKGIVNGINNKTSAEKRNDVFYPLFAHFGIEKDSNNQQFTAEDARKLYDHYFSKEKDPNKKGVKQFVKDVLAAHTQNQKVDMNKLKQNLPDLKKLAGIFGEESAAMVEQLIMAEARLKTEPNFVKKLPNDRKNTLSPEEHRILAHINEAYQEEKREKAKALEEKLPIMKYQEQLKAGIRNQARILLVGGTGCGKTVGFPFMIRAIMQEERDRGRDPGKFVITEPTIINTDSLTAKIASDGVATLGEEVDCQHSQRDGRFNPEADTVLMTQRSLINMFLQKNEHIKSMRYLMIDEAHALSTDTVLLLALGKEEQKRREEAGQKPPLSIFVASATIDEDKFKKDLGLKGVTIDEYLVKDGVTKIEGTEPDITDVFASESSDIRDLPKKAAEKIKEIIETKKGDILHFVPGNTDIEATIDEVNRAIEQYNLQQYGEILPPMGLKRKTNKENEEEYKEKVAKATKKSADDKLRIVCSTNFAETGITIEGLKYVVDTGLKKEMTYDPQTKMQRLLVVKASKDECMQRRGRVGRIEHGEWRPLYTKGDFNGESKDGTGKKRPEHIDPEIMHTDLRGYMLLLKSGDKDIRSLDLLYKPTDEIITSFENDLVDLGALTRVADGTEITDLGKEMEGLSIGFEDIHHQRMIADANLNHPKELGDICALIALAKKPLLKGNTKEDPRARSRARKAFEANSGDFIDKSSDFITLLRMWETFNSKTANEQEGWADNLGLNLDELKRMRGEIDKLFNTAQGNKKQVKAGLSYDYPTIRTMIENGYRDRIMTNESGSYAVEGYERKDDDPKLIIGNQSVLDKDSPRILVGDIYFPDGKNEGYLSPCQVVA